MEQNKKCDVILTYSWNRVGYNILRSLTAKGLSVVVADTSKTNICSMSKFSMGSFTYPNPFTDEEGFINKLLEKVIELQPKVLLPIHDEAVVVAKYIDRFPKDLVIPIAPYETLCKLSDKAQATEIAKSVGVPVPQAYTKDNVQFPAVFKSVIGNSAKDVYFPKDIEELNGLIEQYKGKKTLLQEKCSGVDHSVDCVRSGNFFYATVYRALITKTDGGGTTTQRVIVENPDLVDYAKRILDAVNYNGVCGMDFKFDCESEKSAFIEVNARYTGGLATPIAAGFDIPYIHYCLSTNTDFDKNIKVKFGTKTKWILGDIITFVGRLVKLKFNKKEFSQLFNFKFDALDDFRKDDKKAILGEMSYYLVKLLKNRKLNP